MLPGIAEANPNDERSGIGCIGESEEIYILTDDRICRARTARSLDPICAAEVDF